MVDLWLWIAALFSEIVGTMAGFGSSTIFLPIALFFFDFRTALILVAIFHISGNLGRMAFFRKGLDKKLLITFGIPSVILTILGALLVNYISQSLLKIILGGFLISFVFLSWNKGLSVKKNKKNSIIGGSLSGFLAGLIGTGGALRGAFLQSFKLDKSVYIPTAAAISLAVDVSRIPIYIGSGFLPKEFIYMIPILFVLAMVGSFIGKKIVNKIPQHIFRRFVLVAIFLVSVKFVIEGFIF